MNSEEKSEEILTCFNDKLMMKSSVQSRRLFVFAHHFLRGSGQNYEWSPRKKSGHRQGVANGSGFLVTYDCDLPRTPAKERDLLTCDLA